MKRLLLGVLVSIAIATPAQAVTLVLPDGTGRPQPYQRWADSTNLRGAVALHLEPCGAAPACAEPGNQAVWVDPAIRRWDRRVMLLHELGHLYDAAMPEWKREWFTAVMRLTGPWDQPVKPGWADGPPIEQFAQAYALCALAPSNPWDAREWDAVYGYWPSRLQHQVICNVIAAR